MAHNNPSTLAYAKRQPLQSSRGADYKHREPKYESLPSEYTHRKPAYVTPHATLTDRRRKQRVYKRKLALLLPAHNEELLIQATIRSAIAAGQPKEDIYVVDDCSTDSTRRKAIASLTRRQVLTVERSGKIMAVHQAIKYFEIESKYSWLHVADSDSVFGPDYFRIYRRSLSGRKYAAAVGFVQSLRGNWISKYRAFCYTYGQHLIRRTQSWFGMISVMPGPISSFRTDIIQQLDFDNDSITEDLDLTFQIHRKKLGRIQFIPGAVNFTQDPQTLSDFCKQTARWQRGFFQVMTKHRIGTKRQLIDVSISYQMLQLIFYLVEIGVIIPYVIITTGRWIVIPLMLLGDFVVMAWLALFSAAVAKRLSILSALPYFFFLRWLELGIFLKAFVEVIILKKYRGKVTGWQTEGRRYALDAAALKDAA